jgi:hypothetical protein
VAVAINPAGQAVWNQRHRLAATADRLRELMRAVGQTVDLSLNQWVQLTAFALDFRPDLIIELGRERGNSTCCFLEAAELLRPEQDCRVVSLCLTDYWAKETRPRLERVCSHAWFARGEILRQNLLKYDFAAAIGRSRRVLLFWDAHGFDIAECVLGRVLPVLADRHSAVMLHDMSDLRYDGAPPASYGPQGIWKGARDNHGTFWLGHINSHVAQAVSVVDFTTRNRIPLHSAGEEMHREFASDAGKAAEMARLLGDEMFRLPAHWFWFSLDEAPGPVALQSRALSLPPREKGWP